jgi:hypothetical protein
MKVTAGGSPVLLAADAASIVGCPFTLPGGKPQPCVTVSWSALATRVALGGPAPILESSVGLCKSAEGIVQGTVLKMAVQTRATAT